MVAAAAAALPPAETLAVWLAERAQLAAVALWLAGGAGAAASAALPALRPALTYGRLSHWPGVPKRWFTAFYAVGLLVSCALRVKRRKPRRS